MDVDRVFLRGRVGDRPAAFGMLYATSTGTACWAAERNMVPSTCSSTWCRGATPAPDRLRRADHRRRGVPPGAAERLGAIGLGQGAALCGHNTFQRNFLAVQDVRKAQGRVVLDLGAVEKRGPLFSKLSGHCVVELRHSLVEVTGPCHLRHGTASGGSKREIVGGPKVDVHDAAQTTADLRALRHLRKISTGQSRWRAARTVLQPRCGR